MVADGSSVYGPVCNAHAVHSSVRVGRITHIDSLSVLSHTEISIINLKLSHNKINIINLDFEIKISHIVLRVTEK